MQVNQLWIHTVAASSEGLIGPTCVSSMDFSSTGSDEGPEAATDVQPGPVQGSTTDAGYAHYMVSSSAGERPSMDPPNSTSTVFSARCRAKARSKR